MPARLTEDALTLWREAERQLGRLSPRSNDYEIVRDVLTRGRELYAVASQITDPAGAPVAVWRRELDELRARLEAVIDRNRDEGSSPT